MVYIYIYIWYIYIYIYIFILQTNTAEIRNSSKLAAQRSRAAENEHREDPEQNQTSPAEMRNRNKGALWRYHRRTYTGDSRWSPVHLPIYIYP